MKVACKILIFLTVLLPISTVAAIGFGEEDQTIEYKSETITEEDYEYNQTSEVKTSTVNEISRSNKQAMFDDFEITSLVNELMSKIRTCLWGSINCIKDVLISFYNWFVSYLGDFLLEFLDVIQFEVNELSEDNIYPYYPHTTKTKHVAVETICLVKNQIVVVNIEKQRRDLVRKMTLF